MPSYAALSIIIAIGTSLGLWFFGIRTASIIVLINSVAILCGLTIAVINRKRYKKLLNKQLQEFKGSQ